MNKDRESYKQLLLDLNMTEEQVQVEVQRDDIRPVEMDVYIDESCIHGLGLFAKRACEISTLVCPTRIGNYRTEAGRYTNHSCKPNTLPVVISATFYLVAIKDIKQDEEITVDYNRVLNLNKRV